MKTFSSIARTTELQQNAINMILIGKILSLPSVTNSRVKKWCSTDLAGDQQRFLFVLLISFKIDTISSFLVSLLMF